MAGLLDVNILVALVVPEHEHHELVTFDGGIAAIGGDDAIHLQPPAAKE
jgi:hypothetical protein